MLGLASLMTIIILCVAQDMGNTPVRLRAISDQTTASVKRDEGSSSNDDSSQFSSLPRSLHGSDHHANKTKQSLQLHSKFSRNEVVKWDETDNNATEVELEKQVNRDEGRQVVEWTNARRRRVETRHNSETSSSKLQRQKPNSVGETSKEPSRILRQRRSPVKRKSSRALRGRNLRRRALGEPRSSAGLDVERSKTRRRKSRTAAAARDGHHGNVNSNKRRRLNRRQWDEEEDEEEEEEEAEADEEEFKDERDVGLEESVQKRESDEVLISKDVLTAMNERILARVKDFIDQNTEKKLNLSSSSPSSLLSNHSTEVSGGMGTGTGMGVGNATTEASSSVHPNSSTTH